jgi:hypothetical protein
VTQKSAQAPAHSPHGAPLSEIILIKLAPPLPGPRLKEWLKAAGISWASRKLGLSRLTLQSWLRQGMYGRVPSVEAARLIIALSHERPLDIGPLTYEDIWGAVIPQREVKHSNRKH